MAGHDIVVVGASSGGVEALTKLVRGLPAGLPAAVCVVCHFPPEGSSVLPEILSRNGKLLATHATDGEPLYPGHIYIAPPDHHLLLEEGRARLDRGVRENNLRPAIDPLFRSAARVYGPRVVGVILSGAGHDGVAGLLAVRGAGGLALVQDPEDATITDLPQLAVKIAGADATAPIAILPSLLADLVARPVPAGGPPMVDPLERMPTIVNHDQAEQEQNRRGGQLSTFTCPECGGSLWQVDERQIVRFRCHVGHSYYAEGLLAEQSANLEAALWTAVRTFREKAVLSKQLAHRARNQNNGRIAERFEEQADQAHGYAESIQKMLQGNNGAPGPTSSPELPTTPNQAETVDPRKT